MALLHLDGFEAANPLAYDSVANFATQTVYVRTGARGLGTAASVSVTSHVGNKQTLIAGTGEYFGVYSAISVFFLDDANVQLEFRVHPLGSVQVFRGTTQIGSHSLGMLLYVWYYFEFACTIHSTDGSYTIRVNGQPFASQSHINTQATGNAYANKVRLSTSATTYADDYYIVDTLGNDCNDFLGPVRVAHLLPNANGNASQWMGSDGDRVNNYLLVNEAMPNGDTNYVYSNTSGEKDTYNMQDLPSQAFSVVAAAIVTYARNDGGSPSYRHVVRHSGSEWYGATIAPGATYQYDVSLLGGINPVTSSAWTVTDINNLEVGVQVP